jgi:ribosomal protein L25 (general stress protein Ctc)
MHFNEKIIGELRKRGEKIQGKVCCVIYSKNFTENLLFSLTQETVKKIDNFIVKNRQLNYVFDITIGESQYKVMIRERQRNYLSNEIFHLDFLELHEESKTNMKVEVIFLNKGNSNLEKTNKVSTMSSPKFLPVRCYGINTLSTISVDLNDMVSNTALYSNQLNWPENITCNIVRLVLKSVAKKVTEKAVVKEKGKKK